MKIKIDKSFSKHVEKIKDKKVIRKAVRMYSPYRTGWQYWGNHPYKEDRGL